MQKHIVKCRVCNVQFDTEALPRDEWVMPSNRYYYHTKCYETWKKNKDDYRYNSPDNEKWFEFLKEYLSKEVKAPINYAKLNNQWNSYLKKSYTAKGIYLSMKYFFETGRGEPSKTDGIGIIPYIYKDATIYWTQREQRESGICNRIEEQMLEQAELRTVKAKLQKPKKKKSKKYDFGQLGTLEDNDE